jgi:hypothetical protein
MSAVIGIDKLNIRLKYSTPRDLHIYLGYKIKNLTTKPISVYKHYEYSHSINYKGIEIGVLNSGLMHNKSNNHIIIFNYVFYTQQQLLREFESEINALEICDISKLEIFIDSDTPITQNTIVKLQKTKRLQLRKNYVENIVYTNYRNNELVKNPSRTHYFEAIGRQKSKKYYLRLENKTEEIKKSQKHYITTFHENSGLDINKPIYRLELVIPSMECLNKGVNTFYKSSDIDNVSRISAHKINKHKLEIESLEKKSSDGFLIFNSGYLVKKNLVEEYRQKVNFKTQYYINIGNLSDSDYLITIFSTLSKLVIKNVSDILPKGFFSTKKLEIKDIEMNKHVKKMKNNVPGKYYTVQDFMTELDISQSEAEELRDITIRDYNTNRVNEDLFKII